MLMSTMSSLNISISLRRKLMLMPMTRLSSLAHKLLMLMFMLMLASLVRTGLTCFPPVLFFNEISTFHIHPFLSMAQCYKRRGRLSFDSDISSPEGKKDLRESTF